MVRSLKGCDGKIADSAPFARVWQWVIGHPSEHHITTVNGAPMDVHHPAEAAPSETDGKLATPSEVGIWVSATAGNRRSHRNARQASHLAVFGLCQRSRQAREPSVGVRRRRQVVIRGAGNHNRRHLRARPSRTSRRWPHGTRAESRGKEAHRTAPRSVRRAGQNQDAIHEHDAGDDLRSTYPLSLRSTAASSGSATTTIPKVGAPPGAATSAFPCRLRWRMWEDECQRQHGGNRSAQGPRAP